ncbi:MAG TPA: multicopper oxidase domain-containing protein, partial [Rhodanobacteraceae bacterium]|nr:multicopper oxidase domain-containing protein [Rhodanobacteraceae bacterium]
MKQKSSGPGSFDPMLSRRRFVQGLALGGAAAMFGGFAKPAMALQTSGHRSLQGMGESGVLSGTEFALEIAETPVNFTGKAGRANTVNGLLPGPLLRWREGTTVTLRVTNRLREQTSIHWHGILVPANMDGVPGFSFPGIAPGETFVYRFPVKQSGTYWYHSHSGFQEQTGPFGPLVIDPAGPDRIQADRDYVVMLNDWTDEDPMTVFTNLKKVGDYYNYGEPTVRDFVADVSHMGLEKALASRKMWNEMRMTPRDL